VSAASAMKTFSRRSKNAQLVVDQRNSVPSSLTVTSSQQISPVDDLDPYSFDTTIPEAIPDHFNEQAGRVRPGLRYRVQ
jgi:hypothetical protein